MAKGFNLKAIFSADTKDIEAGSTRATESVKRFDRESKAALDEFAGRTEVAGKKAQILGKNIGNLAVKFAAAAVSIRSLVSAVKTIASFEKANSTLAAVLGTTAGKIKELTESAIELGRRTEYTATQVTELQTELAKLGFSAPQIMSMQESVLKFAAAVGTDLASAAARAGATMRGFDLTADETSDLLAVMAVSTSKSALSFGYLDETLGKIIPVTKSFGIDARGTTALLGALANAGIDASSAGTALRQIMTRLADSGSALNKTLGSQPKTMEEVIAALQTLRDRGVGVKEAMDLVGRYSGATFLALVNGADDVSTLYGELQNVDTALNDMYETMTDNVEGAVKQLQSAWEGLILSFRESQGPIKTALLLLRDMVQEANRLLFKGARDSEAKSKYSSILGGIFDREGIEGVKSFVENETKILNDEIAKTQKNAKRQGILGAFSTVSAFNFVNSKSDIAQYESMLEGLGAAFESLQERALHAGETVENFPSGSGGGKSDGGSDGKDKKSNGIFDADTLAEIEEMRMIREESEDMARRAQEAWNSMDHVADPAIASLMQFAKVNLSSFKTAEEAYSEFVEAQRKAEEESMAIQERWEAQIKSFSESIQGILQDAMIDSFANLGTFIGEALSGSEDAASNFSSAMLSTLADMAIKVGELAIGFGITASGIKTTLETMANPAVAIAAGAALVMLGNAVKAGLANASRGGGYTSAAVSSASSSGGYGSDNYQAREITVNVTGTLVGNGSQLVAVINNENKRKNLTT